VFSIFALARSDDRGEPEALVVPRLRTKRWLMGTRIRFITSPRAPEYDQTAPLRGAHQYDMRGLDEALGSHGGDASSYASASRRLGAAPVEEIVEG
jgi:hypothetical protein